MKFLFSINILFALLLGCSTKQSGKDIEYIKVLTEGLADTITPYNKGLGLGSYLYHEPKKDSVVVQFSESTEPRRYKTYIGAFNNGYYLDTILTLIEKLRSYPNGFLPDTTPIGSVMYSGPVFFVEYKDSKGVHNIGFDLVDGNDTLDQFYKFYENLFDLRWRAKLADNSLVNQEYEIVEAIKRIDRYDEIEEPYFPAVCETGIDFSKLYGRWRSVNEDLHSNNKMNFNKLVFSKDGTFFIGRVRNGIQKQYNDWTRFVINKKDTTITMKAAKWPAHTEKILMLTDSCLTLVYIDNGEKKVTRYNRL